MTLCAGPLTAIYASGELRDVRWRGQPLLSRLYAAVRDENWGTIPGEVVEESVEPDRVRFTVRHADVFLWHGEIRLTSDGGLTFAFDGEALRDFRRNRIGFCLLHPASQAGAPCRIARMGGVVLDAVFPERVCPDQPVEPFLGLRALAPTLPDGSQVRLELSGDVFELEDQRNWTDASFKTFCTPLSLPFPVLVKAGERIEQQVRIVQCCPPSARSSPRPREAGETHEIPPPGGGESEALGGQAEDIRVDLFGTPSDSARLARADALAVERGVGLEIALIGCPEAGAGVRTEASIQRWLVLPASENPNRAPDHRALLLAAQNLRRLAPVFAGTDSDFFFVNRFPPPMELCDGLTFAVNPQVHAFDEASIRETPESYPAVLATAREISGGKPVIVSPLTLGPRWNPYATSPMPRDVPIPQDPRTGTEFGRVWLDVARKALLAAGAASVTLDERYL